MEEKDNFQYISMEKKAYPEKLRHIFKPPKGLYVRGSLPEEGRVCLAMIGARECSLYGKEAALYFAEKLSAKGVQIISGLARGIDGFAHKGALLGGGETYGVLGCGLDICYPEENRYLYEKMIRQGGIISEYGLKTPPKAFHFPERNRIISGLSDGILVLEAREKSGSLITVEHGLEQGKDIFVLPGRIDDELSKGCNRLLKAGAIPVTEPEDIFSFYGIENPDREEENKKKNFRLEKEEEMVYSRLCLVPRHVNEIVFDTRLPIYTVIETLVSLEKKGYVKQTLKNFYIKKKN